jgi:hypothetical protein
MRTLTDQENPPTGEITPTQAAAPQQALSAAARPPHRAREQQAFAIRAPHAPCQLHKQTLSIRQALRNMRMQ